MLDENGNEIPAQDPNAPDGQNAESTEVVKPAVDDGVQKRIDALTAGMRDAERRAEQANERLLNHLATASATSAPVDEYAEVDPQVRKLIEASTRGLKAELQKSQNQMAGMIAAQEARTIVAKAGIQDSAVAERAVALAAGWKSNGLQFSAAEAAQFAIGEAIMNGTYTPAAPGPQRRGAPPIGGGVRSPNLNGHRQQAALPSNFDELSLDEQISLLDKRGVGNEPI